MIMIMERQNYLQLFSLISLTSNNDTNITPISINTMYQPRPGWEYITLPFAVHELSNTIQHIRNKVTTGYDKIHPTWLKNLTPSYKQELLNCYNHGWDTSTFSNVWKCSSLLPILEEKKPKYDPESDRLIMIALLLGTIREEMIYNRILWFVVKNNMIPHAGTGFRIYHSSTDTYGMLTNAINESICK